MERLFDRDPLTGAVEFLTYDETTGYYGLRRTEDVEPVIEANKRLYTQDDGWSPTREARRVASIPFGVYLEWKEKFGIDAFDKNHAEAVARLLDSSEYLYLRTAPGQLGSRKTSRNVVTTASQIRRAVESRRFVAEYGAA